MHRWTVQVKWVNAMVSAAYLIKLLRTRPQQEAWRGTRQGGFLFLPHNWQLAASHLSINEEISTQKLYPLAQKHGVSEILIPNALCKTSKVMCVFSKEIAWLRTKFNSHYAFFPLKHYIYSGWVSQVPFGSPVLRALRLGILSTTKSTSLSMNSPARWPAKATEVSRFCPHTVLSISFSTTHS